MRRGCSVAGHIKCCAPTDCDHERMAADSMSVDCTPHRIYVAAIVLHGFAAGHHDRRRNALDGIGVEAAIVLDLLQEVPLRSANTFIDDEESASRIAARCDHFSQSDIAGIKSLPRKVN